MPSEWLWVTSAAVSYTHLAWARIMAGKKLICTANMSARAGSMGISTSVSYTHLDVYKRQTLDIALADVMAFGDNDNDVSMLDIVGTPYIMDGAAAPLRSLGLILRIQIYRSR